MTPSAIITLTGDIDMHSLEELRAALASFRESKHVHAVVDLTDVTFFGSEGVGLVARLVQCAEARGGTVTLVNASPDVRRVTQICGLLEVVHLERHFARRAAS